MRVGALPKFPSNALNYNLTWSTDGVINEYCEPCEAIVNGQLRETQPLEEREEFSLDGVFTRPSTPRAVSAPCANAGRQGSQSQLPYDSLSGPCRHHEGPAQRPAAPGSSRSTEGHLENAVPKTLQDVVIVFVTVSGIAGVGSSGDLCQQDLRRPVGGRMRSAIQITTAGGICAVLDMLSVGHLPQAGLIRQEEIGLQPFLANRFGRCYATTAPRSQAA